MIKLKIPGIERSAIEITRYEIPFYFVCPILTYCCVYLHAVQSVKEFRARHQQQKIKTQDRVKQLKVQIELSKSKMNEYLTEISDNRDMFFKMAAAKQMSAGDMEQVLRDVEREMKEEHN